MATDSRYVVQRCEKSRCYVCGRKVYILCPNGSTLMEGVQFYICWSCQRVAEIGVGVVPRA